MRRILLLLLLTYTYSLHAACEVSGCNGELCTEADEQVFSTCLWKATYMCYPQYGICEKDKNGVCGWRETPSLIKCIKNAEAEVEASDISSD